MLVTQRRSTDTVATIRSELVGRHAIAIFDTAFLRSPSLAFMWPVHSVNFLYRPVGLCTGACIPFQCMDGMYMTQHASLGGCRVTSPPQINFKFPAWLRVADLHLVLCMVGL